MTTLSLWHSYRGDEERALDQVVATWNAQHPDVQVEPLAVPYEVLPSKLTTAIPRGGGPDLFVFAHERTTGWARENVARAVDVGTGFEPGTVEAFTVDGKAYAFPLATKSLALFTNPALVPTAPSTTDDLKAIARQEVAAGRIGLATQAQDFYFHAPWWFGYGAALLDHRGRVDFRAPAAVASFDFVGALSREGLLLDEATGPLIAQAFNEGRAGMVVDGPWFTGEIAPGRPFEVHPLPVVSATGMPARPFLTVEGVFVSTSSDEPGLAEEVARGLASTESALVRATIGRQVVATTAAWADPALASDPVLSAFRAQAQRAVPMDNRPEMRDVWEPGTLGLQAVLRGEDAAVAAQSADRRYRAIARPPMPPSDPRPYEAFGAVAGVGLGAWGLLTLRRRWSNGDTERAVKSWPWVLPALVTTAVLVFAPLLVGLALSFFEHRDGAYTFVGFANFADLLLARTFGPMEPLGFYYSLAVTVLWTAVNVVLHLVIGLGLAVALHARGLRLRALYRVILVLPWAVPNYITALLWKGLFNRQQGAINAMLEAVGISGVAWFQHFWTAFFANVCTNVWLGFPFMMVMAQGGLQAIPDELHEAAALDGANGWQRFRHVTLPLLRPALVPAMLLGIVWTFNQFNVIYLVSGGEPDNSTDILVSEAWRWAFGRREQYGIAAATAALIFVLLWAWSAVARRIASRASGEAA